MDINKNFTELTDNIIYNFIVYIPTNNDLIKNALDEATIEKIKDQIVCFDSEYKMTESKNFSPLIIFTYSKQLSDNILKILELKQNLNEEVHIVLWEKYIKILKLFCKLSDYFSENIALDVPNIEYKIKSFISTQNLFINNHLLEVNAIEPLPKIVIETKTNRRPSKKEPKKNFREFLIHEKKEEIEKIIITNFSNLKGITIRYLIEYLTENKILLIEYGSKSNFHFCLSKLLNNKDIGTRNSIFDVKIDTKKDVKYLEIEPFFKKQFEKII